MAVENRDCGLGNQRDVIAAPLRTLVTGASYAVALIPYPCALQAAAAGAFGLSGSPILSLNVARLVSGGLTVIPLGTSGIVLQNANASGFIGFSGIQSIGSSLLALQTGDVITASLSGANSAVDQVALCLIVQKSADLVSHLRLAAQ